MTTRTNTCNDPEHRGAPAPSTRVPAAGNAPDVVILEAGSRPVLTPDGALAIAKLVRQLRRLDLDAPDHEERIA